MVQLMIQLMVQLMIQLLVQLIGQLMIIVANNRMKRKKNIESKKQ
jgi:hypothetical protein